MEHLRLTIHGIVQGVGFRPAVHRLTKDLSLTGNIRNTPEGVCLELEGKRSDLERFQTMLSERAPGAAHITGMEAEFSGELQNYSGFSILKSSSGDAHTLISPDLCICEKCLKEFRTPSDRRYRYPFINCTDCGPRFTIIRNIPYDRANTSMQSFRMCPECEQEYSSIETRRYHAQPDCCPDCGPELKLLRMNGEPVTGDPIEKTRECLRRGGIVAIKGLGGYHLACIPERETVETLRRRKHRDARPLALMCADPDAVKTICEVSGEEEQLLLKASRPIVLLKKRRADLEYISHNAYIGVMLPYTPLHYLLMENEFSALVMTSANLSELPIVSSDEQAFSMLEEAADLLLTHTREIVSRCDDSLCFAYEGHEYFLRRSRGYVPLPVRLPFEADGILACGAEQKASFCMSRDDEAFLSPHIGDLKNLETLDFYTKQMENYRHLFHIRPRLVACDLHPDYMSTAFAEEYSQNEKIPTLQIQHHHAHMASCMADNGLDERCAALVWDGTGLGTDGSIWGAECLCGDYSGFERMGTMRQIPLIGGDRVTAEPLRTAFALLEESGCDTESIPGAEFFRLQLQSGINIPKSSGMGRLFDGVSAILGICTECSYEGQAAVQLEAAADTLETPETEVYPYLLEGDPLCFDWRPMIRAICSERKQGTENAVIAARFMNTLADMAISMLCSVTEVTGIRKVLLSGGSFQNMYLMHRLPGMLRNAGLEIYTHKNVSPNDEGLALGQLCIAARMSRKNRE